MKGRKECVQQECMLELDRKCGLISLDIYNTDKIISIEIRVIALWLAFLPLPPGFHEFQSPKAILSCPQTLSLSFVFGVFAKPRPLVKLELRNLETGAGLTCRVQYLL